eukprot:7139619-Alexandrium_andersonii.AAC.1
MPGPGPGEESLERGDATTQLGRKPLTPPHSASMHIRSSRAASALMALRASPSWTRYAALSWTDV